MNHIDTKTQRNLSLYPKYESYKDSGVEWLGEIPSDWSLLKITHAFDKVGSGTTPSTSIHHYYDGNINWVQTGDLNDGLLLRTSKKITEKALKNNSSLKIYSEGSLIIAMYGATIGKVSILGVEAATNQACCVLSQSKVVDIKYSFYVFHGIKKNLISMSYGGGQPNISQELIRSLRLPFPSIDTQQIIANFLDQKTAQIDQAVEIKEKQIALLKERKQILIQNAVTQGLNLNAPMKDSGIDWIGQIPAHWSLQPGFMIFSESKRINKGMVDDSVLSLSYGNIILKPKEKLVGLVPESFETYQLVQPGDIIVRCTDLQNDKTSLRTGISKFYGIITSAYLNLRVKTEVADYIYSYLHALDITKVIYKFGSGLRQNLSFNDFKHMKIVVPPIEEQKDIVEFIQTQSQKIDQAIALQQQQIDKLKEYKTTLINSAVTGKVKVF